MVDCIEFRNDGCIIIIITFLMYFCNNKMIVDLALYLIIYLKRMVSQLDTIFFSITLTFYLYKIVIELTLTKT